MSLNSIIKVIKIKWILLYITFILIFTIIFNSLFSIRPRSEPTPILFIIIFFGALTLYYSYSFFLGAILKPVLYALVSLIFLTKVLSLKIQNFKKLFRISCVIFYCYLFFFAIPVLVLNLFINYTVQSDLSFGYELYSQIEKYNERNHVYPPNLSFLGNDKQNEYFYYYLKNDTFSLSYKKYLGGEYIISPSLKKWVFHSLSE